MTDKNNNKTVGDKGESIAANVLLEKDYKILKRNYHSRYGEIDIIALKGDELVFVEVKTRIGESFISPKEAVNYKKQEKIKKTALLFMNDFKGNYFLRFDVFEIFLDEELRENKKYNHIKNAF